MKDNDIIKQVMQGGLTGEYSITNCYAVGYLTSESYPKQHEQDTQSERHSSQDGISRKPANARCSKKDGSS